MFKHCALKNIIAPWGDVQSFYIKYRTACEMHMHAGAVIKLMYGFVYVREIIHSPKLVDYRPVHVTHKPYVTILNLH